MPIDFSVVLHYWPVLLKGLGLTLGFTLVCAVLGSLVGEWAGYYRSGDGVKVINLQ